MAAGTPPPFDADEKQILVFTGLAHALTHYVELTWPTLAVVLALETGIPLERVLGWSFAGYVLFGVGALPAGLLADRLGGRRLILLGQCLAAASLFGAAFAEPGGWALVLCLAGMGLGVSTYHPAGMGLISRAVRARGAALGINGIYGNVGIALAPLLTAFLAETLGWRATLAVTAVLLLAAIALGTSLRFCEPPPVPHHEATHGPRVSTRHALTFLLLCGTALLGGFAYRANTLSQPALFAERVDVLDFGVAVSLSMLVGIAGQYVGGRIADRFPLGWGYVGFHLLSLPMLVAMLGTTNLALVGTASLYVFFALGMQPIENSLFAHLTPERWRSTAYGLKFTLTFGVGATAVGMVERVAANGGFAGVYQVLAGVVTLLVGLAVVLAWMQRGASPARYGSVETLAGPEGFPS